MPRRVVRFGIDYGTSFSKIVFRDYGAAGGDKAFVMPYKRDFRVPSAVGVTSSEFIFGSGPQSKGDERGVVWHESLKMRVAGEVKGDYGRYCYGSLRDLPSGFSAKDMAILTVWFLISEAERAVLKYFKGKSVDVALGFSLGTPMSFYNDRELRETFLEIARTAWEISQGFSAGGVISLKDARKALEFGYGEVEESGSLPEDETRNWVRTEAEAALWWPFQSPSVSDGPYAQIDVGAGTTNVSIFRIVPKHVNGHWVKESISFFGADAPPVGMDAVDKKLALWKFNSDESCLSLRGQEKDLFKTKGAVVAISEVLEVIHHAYRDTILRAFATHLQSTPERDRWKKHKVFFIGGGSQIEALVRELQKSPIAGVSGSHEALFQEKPADLFAANGSKVSSSMLSHVAVAYGLSNLAADLPKAESPNEVPAMQPWDLNPKRFKPLLEKDEWRFG
jgi:hypothetical protein